MKPTKQEIERLHIENRISYTKIGKMYGMKQWQVQKLAQKEYGVSSPRSTKAIQNEIDSEKVKKMYLSGMSAPKIAKELKIGNELVYTIIRKAGIIRAMSEAKKLIPSHWNGRKHTTMAREKISIARKGKYTGKDNPNWHGGMKYRYQNLRFGVGYADWLKNVKQRDGKCMECGSKEKLVAHHIIPVREMKDLKLLIDINNGITLCKNCHKKTFYREKKYEKFYFDLLENRMKSGEAQNG